MKEIFAMMTIIFLALENVYSIVGIDVSDPLNTSTFQCLKNNGCQFAIVRAYRSLGTLDTHAVESLTNAQNAGLNTDIYMFPCRGKSAVNQVDQMMAGIPDNLYERVWIDVQTNPSSGCSWSGHDVPSNCQFLKDTVNRILEKGKKVGIYSTAYMWQTIFGHTSACQAVAIKPLWYAHYDNKPQFSDFVPFGGWLKPTMKQYKGDTILCGAGVDLNFYP